MNKAALGSVERLEEQDPDSAKERPVDEGASPRNNKPFAKHDELIKL